MCYGFIWGKKRRDVSDATLSKDMPDGGIKLLDMSAFDNSLKMTWLRKILTIGPESKEFPNIYKIDIFINMDSIDHHRILVVKRVNTLF